MFKLVAIGGKLRGKTFELNEGDNILGRGSDCDISISVEGVSKQHFKITVNKDKCFIQDLGSSNGTFVNGKLVKRMTVENKDQVAIPNVIFQVVYVKEKVIHKTEFSEQKVDYSLEHTERPPNDFLGKIRFSFKHKIMQVLYSFNEQYEWSVLIAILLFLFTCFSITASIGPVITRGTSMLKTEINARASQYVNEVARNNAIYMGQTEYQKIDIKYLSDFGIAEGIEYYELVDMKGNVIRPAEKIDTQSQDRFTLDSLTHFKRTKKYSDIHHDELPNDEVGVAKVLQVVNSKTGNLQPVGLISIRLRPKTLVGLLVSNSRAYLKALIYSSIIGVIFYGFIFYLTIKPLEEMRRQTINARAKRIKELSSKFLFMELKPIREEINGLLQTISQLDGDEDSEMILEEDDGDYVENLHEIAKGINCAYIILNSTRLIQYSNERTYELIGLREDFAKDKELTESVEKDGLADELLLLCDDSESREGENVSEEYELAGETYIMNVKAMLGKNRTGQAYFITFTKEA